MRTSLLSGDGQTGRHTLLVEERPRYQPEVEEALERSRAAHLAALQALGDPARGLATAAHLLVRALTGGHTVLVTGNGGSAAEAQHFAAELVGRFKCDRAPFAALALTTDSSILTAVGNDYGYDQVFARQVRALGRAGDVLVAFSTSGESENLVLAAEAARERALTVIAVTGDRLSRLAERADLTLAMPATDTATVQELHMVTTHLLCGIVEAELA